MKKIQRIFALLFVLGCTGCSSNSGANDDTETTETSPDHTAPTVVSTTPTNGASGVYENDIVIEFSEPMDQVSVENAFASGLASGDMTSEEASFAWDDSGTRATIAIAFPFGEDNTQYGFTIGTDATDLSGEPLAEPFDCVFELAQQVSVFLTGDSYGHMQYGNPYTWFQTGSSSTEIIYGRAAIVLEGRLPPFDSVARVISADIRATIHGFLSGPDGVETFPFGTTEEPDGILPLVIEEFDTLEWVLSDDTHVTGTVGTFIDRGESPQMGDTVRMNAIEAFVEHWQTNGEEANWVLRFAPSQAMAKQNIVRFRRNEGQNEDGKNTAAQAFGLELKYLLK